MADQRPLEPGEVGLREEIERDVRAELEPEYDAARVEEMDRAKRAVVIAFFAMAMILTPIAAAVLGLSVRLFLFAAFR